MTIWSSRRWRGWFVTCQSLLQQLEATTIILYCPSNHQHCLAWLHLLNYRTNTCSPKATVDLHNDSTYFSYLWSCPSLRGTRIFTYTISRSCLYSTLSLSLRPLRLNYTFFDFFFYFSLLRDLNRIIATLISRHFDCYDDESALFTFLLGLFSTNLAQLPVASPFPLSLALIFRVPTFIFHLPQLR